MIIIRLSVINTLITKKYFLKSESLTLQKKYKNDLQ
jgi:hypothetical protein